MVRNHFLNSKKFFFVTNILTMENLTILLLVITFTCYNASKTDWNANALEFLPNEKRKLKFLQNQQKISHSGKCSAGAKLSSDILGIIASGLSPKESFKMSRTSRSWSKAHKLVYVNLTPTDNPVAIFKKYDEEMFFLEDPNKLLEIGLPQLNYMIPIQYYWTNESNMWMFLFGYAMMGFWKHQNHWAKMRSPPVTKYFTMVPRNFMKSIGKVTAKYCPLDMRLVPPFLPTLHDHDPHCLHLRVYTPLLLAAENNDVEVMRILLKRTEGLLNVPREESFIFLQKLLRKHLEFCSTTCCALAISHIFKLTTWNIANLSYANWGRRCTIPEGQH